jgi:hypothetical protein
MQNAALLTEIGRSGRPALIKRGPAATIDELLAAAEYVLAEGNMNVTLCERGIRTFERSTRSRSTSRPSRCSRSAPTCRWSSTRATPPGGASWCGR